MKLSPIKTFTYYFLQFSLGIIQNVIGLLLFLFLKVFKSLSNTRLFYGALVSNWKYKKSLSLGVFIFLGNNDNRILVHEYGHSIQSIILGPLYLLVIGIPSFIWSICFRRTRRNKKINYYEFYPEKWANILGNNVTGNNII